MRRLADRLVFGVAIASFGACAHSNRDANNPSATQITSFDITNPVDPGGTRRNAEPFTPSPPDLDDPNHPANRLATAACDRKLECDQVGEARPYSTRQACLTDAQRHANDDLNAARCDNGIDDARLSECIYAVRRAGCSPDFTMAGRFLECRSNHLCAK
jgi:hypothetical protein